MATIKLDDIEIYYELHGQGVPLVLIAGHTCDHNYWNKMVNTLAKRFKVLVFDNRAIGQTKDSGIKFSIDTLAEDVMRLIQALNLANPNIIGQSMGGAIAQTFAAKYPEKTNKLIILNSVAKFNIRALMALKSLLNLRKLNISLDSLIETTLPWVFSSNYFAVPDNIKTFKEALISNLYPQSIEDQERQFIALQTFDSRKWLNKIKAPTLVIAAENDALVSVSESQELTNKITNSTIITIPGGHASPIEQPEKLCETILNFFSTLNNKLNEISNG